jgi:hypothetical protein
MPIDSHEDLDQKIPERGRGGLTASAIIWVVGFMLAYVYMLIADEFIECITDNYCVSSKESKLSLSGLYSSFFVLLVYISRAAQNFMGYALQRGFGIYLGGGVLTVLGVFGITILFLVTPREQISNFVHIIIIGLSLSGFGLFMIVKTWQFRKDQQRSQK